VARRQAQLLVAEGFLSDVVNHFKQVDGAKELDMSSGN